jgi:hypothetical protein
MEDSNIIWSFLIREFKNDHPAIYLYVCGGPRSRVTSTNKLIKITKPIFSPPISEEYLKSVVVKYLEMKKKQHMKAEITVKPIYL